MILLGGIRSEPPLALVAAELHRLGASFRWFDQRRAFEASLELEIVRGRARGVLSGSDATTPDAVRLESITAAYVRLMDDRRLPEVERLPADDSRRMGVRALHDRLCAWLDVGPKLVINRAAAQASNASKPYQAQRIAEYGFAVPETLVTNDPELVRAFHARHRRVVVKPMSGTRAVVRVVTDLDLTRLDRIRWCPVQFQAYVEGTDVRVHTVGDRVFAARIESAATDYRYPSRSGASPPVLEAMELPHDLAARCIALAAGLGLELAGIDLRLRPDGEPVCFEVNPSPAFSYYEQSTGLPIAAAVALRLAAAG